MGNYSDALMGFSRTSLMSSSSTDISVLFLTLFLLHFHAQIYVIRNYRDDRRFFQLGGIIVAILRNSNETNFHLLGIVLNIGESQDSAKCLC